VEIDDVDFSIEKIAELRLGSDARLWGVMAEIVIRPAIWHNRIVMDRITRSKEAIDATGETRGSEHKTQTTLSRVGQWLGWFCQDSDHFNRDSQIDMGIALSICN
jgi:hypothetical protein